MGDALPRGGGALTHVTLRGSYIFTRFRVTKSAFTIIVPIYEKTCDIITFTIIITLSYFKIVNIIVIVVRRYDAFT